MKNLIIPSILISLVLAGCSAQEESTKNNDLTSMELKGNIKSLKQTIYTMDCFEEYVAETGRSKMHTDTALIQKSTLNFDKKGFQLDVTTEVIYYGKNVSYVERVKVDERTDSTANITDQATIYRNGEEVENMLLSNSVQYDKNGNIVETIHETEEGHTIIRKIYDIDGRLLFEKQFISNVFIREYLIQTTKYLYSPEGNKKSMTIVGEGDKEIAKGNWYYNEAGQMIKYIAKDSRSEYDYTIEYYHYNKDGNIEKIEQKNLRGIKTAVAQNMLDITGNWEQISRSISNLPYAEVEAFDIITTYDKKHNILEQKTVNANGAIIKHMINEISYY